MAGKKLLRNLVLFAMMHAGLIVTGVVQRCVTFVPQVLLVDVQQDAAVAATHHQQGDDIQRGEMEHVVNGFLPAAAEAAVRRALSEVHRVHCDGPEDKQLRDRGMLFRPHISTSKQFLR